jgi:hypothetical protein
MKGSFVTAALAMALSSVPAQRSAWWQEQRRPAKGVAERRAKSKTARTARRRNRK